MANIFKRSTGKHAAGSVGDTTNVVKTVDAVDVVDSASAVDTTDPAGADGSANTTAAEEKTSLLRLASKVKQVIGKDDRLSSVLNRSEPGAVVDLMKENERFCLPDGKSWVLLGLPVNDASFGGLSKRQRGNSDKGSIVNLIDTDQINCLVTDDLLEEEVLAFIPNESTVDRMNEYGILRDARFMWCVATFNEEKGDVLVFVVPPRKKDHDGLLFNEAKAISDGRLGLEAVIDFELVEAMLAIFTTPDNPESDVRYGEIGVFDAMDCTMDFIERAQKDGVDYTSRDIVDNLIMHFPALKYMDREYIEQVKHEEDRVLTELATGGDVLYDAEIAGDSDDDGAVFDDDLLDDDDIDWAEFDDDDTTAFSFETVDAGNVGNDGANDVGTADTDDTDGTNDIDTDYNDMYGVDDDETETVNVEIPGTVNTAATNAAPVPSHAALSDDQVKLIMDAIESVRGSHDDDIAALREMLDNSAIAGLVSQKQQYTARDQVFDKAVIDNEIMRRYSHELDLDVDGRPFWAALASQPKQIYEYAGGDVVTPWLADQLNKLNVDLNSKLLAQHNTNVEERKRMFFTLVSQSIEQIVKDLDYDNDGTVWNEAYQAIKIDNADMQSHADVMIKNRRDELQRDYQKRCDDFVKAETAKAKADFERREEPLFHSRVKGVESDVYGLINQFKQGAFNDLDRLRKEEAHRRLEVAVNAIVASMAEMVQSHDKVEQEAYEDALATITEYMNTHREDDIKQASVWEEKLKKDTRLEELIKEHDDRVESMKKDNEARIAEIQRHYEEARRNFTAELAESDLLRQSLERTTKERINNAEQEILRVREEADRRVAQVEANVQEIIEQKEQKVRQAEENARYAQESAANDSKMTLLLLIIVPLVTLIAGIAVGMFIF